MSSRQTKDAASRRQGKNPPQEPNLTESSQSEPPQTDALEVLLGRGLAQVIAALLSQKQPRQPRIIPEGVYTVSDLVENLETSEHTIRAWTRRRTNPLKRKTPGTKQMLFKGVDVLAFIDAHG